MSAAVTGHPATFWCIRLMRAADLTGDEVIRIDGTWRELLDVWKDGDDPLTFFGPDDEYGTRIAELLDQGSGLWVVARYVVQERCTPTETDDALTRLFVHDLVEVGSSGLKRPR